MTTRPADSLEAAFLTAARSRDLAEERHRLLAKAGVEHVFVALSDLIEKGADDADSIRDLLDAACDAYMRLANYLQAEATQADIKCARLNDAIVREIERRAPKQIA